MKCTLLSTLLIAISCLILFACRRDIVNSNASTIINPHQDTAKNLVRKLFLSAPEMVLPLKICCSQLPDRCLTDTAVYFGKAMKDNSILLLKNKINNKSPVLYSMNREGQVLDTLVIFHTQCYIGTDSKYEPWIEITKGLHIVLTDTSFYEKIINRENKNEIALTTDTTISCETFYINSSGKFIHPSL